MPFVLKDYAELKKHYDDTVRIILQRGGKQVVEELPDPRKYELQFLTAIFAGIDSELRGGKATKLHASIVYAAMMVIKEDIKSHLTRLQYPESSLLYNRLNDAMGISKADKPETGQTAYAFNIFIKFIAQIFVDQDASKGFIKNHMLQPISPSHLNTLILSTYELAKNANVIDDATLTVAGKSTIVVNDYKISNKTSYALSGKINSWPELQKALHNLTLEELANKNVSSIEKLSKERAAQLGFLKAISETLTPKTNNISDAEKINILAGAMHIVRGQIAMEYSKSSPLSKTEVPNSKIHTGLSAILKMQDAGFSEIELLISATNRFVRHMCIEIPAKIEEKKLIRENSIFKQAHGFNLVHVLDFTQSMLLACRVSAYDTFTKPTMTSSLEYVSAFFKKKVPTATIDSNDDDDDNDDDNNADAGNKTDTILNATL